MISILRSYPCTTKVSRSRRQDTKIHRHRQKQLASCVKETSTSQRKVKKRAVARVIAKFKIALEGVVILAIAMVIIYKLRSSRVFRVKAANII